MKCKPCIRHFQPPKFQCFSSQCGLHGCAPLIQSRRKRNLTHKWVHKWLHEWAHGSAHESAHESAYPCFQPVKDFPRKLARNIPRRCPRKCPPEQNMYVPGQILDDGEPAPGSVRPIHRADLHIIEPAGSELGLDVRIHTVAPGLLVARELLREKKNQVQSIWPETWV